MALGDAVLRAQERMGNPSAGAVEQFGPINQERVLRLIGLDPRDPKAHAVVAVADRYGLDPVLGHIMILVNSRTPYITRDGYLHIAHRSGHLDGIEIVDGPRREGREWQCRVAVYRDDMSHAFTYPGRADVGNENAPEMCIARAERRALRRAFNVSLPPEFGDEDGFSRAAALSSTQSPYQGNPGEMAAGDDPANVRTVETVPLPDDEPPSTPAARMITRGQQIAMLAAFKGLGMSNRDQRLKETIRIIGRDIETSSELTQDEASLVLDELHAALRALDEGNNTDAQERGDEDG